MKNVMLNYVFVLFAVSVFIIWLFAILGDSKREIIVEKHVHDVLNYPRVPFSPWIENSFDIGHILNSNSCSAGHKIVLIITCYVGHVELRSAHRRALPQSLLESSGIKRVFLLAKIPDKDKFISQESIKDESERFGDLVQGDFIEAYRNLTYKHVMGLKWVSANCPAADFVVKLDDDIIFNMIGILKNINSYKAEDKSSFLLGYVISRMKPIRNQANKWFVSYSEYKKSLYPPFLSGWMYITTPQTAAKLVSQAMVTPFFWIDDVFVTGILSSKLGLRLKPLNKTVYLEYSELMDCCIHDMNTKNITCEYSVAPNGGDNNKFVTLVKSLDECYKKKCHPRPLDKPLKDTCVAVKKSILTNKGEPFVNPIRL